MDKLQQIQTKSGAYERKRHKKYLWFKNRGLLEIYFHRFDVKIITPISSPAISFVDRLSWWRKIIYYIQRFFYNLIP